MDPEGPEREAPHADRALRGRRRPPEVGRRRERALRSRPRRLIAVVLVAGAVAGVDQATKAWALAALADGPIDVVGGAVRFRLVRNTGSAFSLFSGQATVLAVLAVVLIAVILRMAHRERDRWVSVGLALLLGGAVGNLVDRVVRGAGLLDGAVVDFVDVGRWPTFNVADSAITVGAALLLLRAWATGRGGAGSGEDGSPGEGGSPGEEQSPGEDGSPGEGGSPGEEQSPGERAAPGRGGAERSP